MANKYICNPMNLEYRYQFFGNLKQPGIFYASKEAADPSLILVDGTYYLFPSVTGGFFTSKDLAEWEFHPFVGEMPVYDYAPDIRYIGGYFYYCASGMQEACDFYRTKDPVSEPFEKVEGSFPFWDPNLFEDEDGRLYLYWGSSNVTPVYGGELDRDTMKLKGEPVELIAAREEELGYERNGADHKTPKTQEQIEEDVKNLYDSIPGKENASEEELAAMRQTLYAYMGNAPYLEGAWMTKHNGIYYLQYAFPGTQYNVYGDAVYISDSPLGPFKVAENNPYSYKPTGFITGAGHGSTVEDTREGFWHISSMRISRNHKFERRLGLWKAGFDADGELYCDQRYGDWPLRVDSRPWEQPEWMLLSYRKPVSVSSGKGVEFITDEDIRTWWKAADNQPGSQVCLDLEKVQDVHAVQINFAEDGIEVQLPEGESAHQDMSEIRFIDTRIQPLRWILEGSQDGVHFSMLADKSQADTDLSHDFLVWETGKQVRYLRLTILELPYAQIPCISGLRVFGKGQGQRPKAADEVTVQEMGELNITVDWKDTAATGYNVLWGYAPDKLYHSSIVYGQCRREIGALMKGKPLYVRVDAFNEAGITEGSILKVR